MANEEAAAQTREPAASRAHWPIIGLCGLAMLVIAYRAFLAFPHSADEYVYLYQARTFLAGRLVNPPLPDPAFQFTHTVATPSGTYGKYAPGWPAVLALGAFPGAPFAVNPLLSMFTLWLVYGLVRRVADSRTALVVLVLLGTSPLFLLNGAALYSHPLAALGSVAVAACVWGYREHRGLRWLLGASASLGVVALARPFDAVALAVALAPFALLHLLRGGTRAALRMLVAALPLLLLAGLYLLYNQQTTGDAFVPGHVAYDPEDRPTLAALHYVLPSLRRIREYALFGHPILLFPLGVFVLRRHLPRGVLAFATLLVLCIWTGYAAYAIDSPPRLGPRHVYISHPFLTMILAGAIVRAVGARWVLPLVVTIVAGQLFHTTVLALEVHHIVRDGTAVFRAAQALERAIAPEKALVILAGPSGTVPAQDLARNDLAFEQRVLFARQRIRGRARWEAGRFRDRRLYVWDGVGGAPVLWAADPEAPIQQVILREDEALGLGRNDAEGWIAAFTANECAPVPYLSLMWRGAFPPDRLSDVQRSSTGHWGPCPGFSDVRRLDRAGIPADLGRKLGIAGHFRSFLTIRERARYRFVLRANERAVLRVGGVPVVEATERETRNVTLDLPSGTYPVALSHSTLWTQALLELRIEGEPGGWELTAQVPVGARLRPRLPETALRLR